jgi:hypothetical protein
MGSEKFCLYVVRNLIRGSAGGRDIFVSIQTQDDFFDLITLKLGVAVIERLIASVKHVMLCMWIDIERHLDIS